MGKMIKEIFIFAFFAFFQVRSRHFLIETEDNAEAGADYNDAYPDYYAHNDGNEDYQSIKNNDAYPDYYAHNDGTEDYQTKRNKNKNNSKGKDKGKNKNNSKNKNKDKGKNNNKNDKSKALDIGLSKAAETFD